MAQPDPNQQLVIDTAAALAGGQQIDDTQRRQAIGWGAKIALDSGDTAAIDLAILVLGGYYTEATHRLVNALSASNGANNAGAPKTADVLDDLIGGGASGPTAASSRPAPKPAPAQPTANPTSSTTTTTGRIK